jgi:hypothetical protein
MSNPTIEWAKKALVGVQLENQKRAVAAVLRETPGLSDDYAGASPGERREPAPTQEELAAHKQELLKQQIEQLRRANPNWSFTKTWEELQRMKPELFDFNQPGTARPVEKVDQRTRVGAAVHGNPMHIQR